jgi:hypothetical protein
LQIEAIRHAMRSLKFQALVVRKCPVHKGTDLAELRKRFNAWSADTRMTLIQIYAKREPVAVFPNVARASGPRSCEFSLDRYVPLGGLGISKVSILPLVEIKGPNDGRTRVAVTKGSLWKPEKRLPIGESIHKER